MTDGTAACLSPTQATARGSHTGISCPQSSANAQADSPAWEHVSFSFPRAKLTGFSPFPSACFLLPTHRNWLSLFPGSRGQEAGGSQRLQFSVGGILSVGRGHANSRPSYTTSGVNRHQPSLPSAALMMFLVI